MKVNNSSIDAMRFSLSNKSSLQLYTLITFVYSCVVKNVYNSVVLAMLISKHMHFGPDFPQMFSGGYKWSIKVVFVLDFGDKMEKVLCL